MDKIKDDIKAKDQDVFLLDPKNLINYQSQDDDINLKKTVQENETINWLILKCEKKIKEVFLFVGKFDRKFDTILKIINVFLKGTDEEKVVYDEYIELNKIQVWKLDDGIITFINSLAKNIIKFITSFLNKFYYIYNTLLCRSLQIADTGNIKIIDIFNKDYDEKKDKIIKNIVSQALKRGIKNVQSTSDISSVAKFGEGTRKKKQQDKHSVKTSVATIFDIFYKHNKTENNIKSMEVLSQTKKLAMHGMLKFTNNLVEDNIGYNFKF